jgi:hypothetical protein
MADDFSADTNTTGRAVVNGLGYPNGNIETAGDHDWFRVWLWANETYVVREIDNSGGTPYNGLTLSDARVALRDSNGNELIHNNDGGLFGDSYLEFVTSHSGFYYVDAGAAGDVFTGTYYVSVAQAADAMGEENLWGNIAAPDTVRFGDFNGDGSSDLINIAPSGAGNINVALSAENGFASGFSLWGNGGVPTDQIGHVNIDRTDDLFQIFNGQAWVALSNGTSFPTYTKWLASGVLPNAVLVEINGDGNGDIYQSDASGHGFVALGNGTNAFAAFTQVLSGTSLNDHIAAVNRDGANGRTIGTDFNGDNLPDVLQFFGGHAYVARATTGGGFVGGTFQDWGALDTLPSDRFGDFNGDHKADLLQYYQGRVYVALSNGVNAFGPYQFWGDGAAPTDQIADMNNDGRADLFQIFQGRAYVALAKGDGTGFTPYKVWADGLNGTTDHLADVNRDGLQDIVEINGGTVHVWESNAVAGGFHDGARSWYDF